MEGFFYKISLKNITEASGRDFFFTLGEGLFVCLHLGEGFFSLIFGREDFFSPIFTTPPQ